MLSRKANQQFKMIKKTTCLFGIAILSIAFFSMTEVALAQEEKIEPRDLRVPISPAINLLGVAPVEVAQPTAAKAFGLTALESVTNSQGDFPNNFAIEFAPYWWFLHPDLSFEEYYEKTGFGQAILQNLSFSVGTTNATIMDDGAEVEGSRVGFGVRTSLLAGNKNPLLDIKIQEYLDLAIRCKRELQDENPSLDPTNTEPIEPGVEILPDCSVQAEKIAKIEEIENLSSDRVGWQLDAANAYVFDSPNNDIDELDLSRIGAWLTVSYRSVSIDRVVENVTTQTCNAEIKSRLKYQTETNSSFNDRDLDAALSGYDCLRSPDGNEIVFFDRQRENVQIGNCQLENSSEYIYFGKEDRITPENLKKYVCVKRSPLSVLKIIDKTTAVPIASSVLDRSLTEQGDRSDRCDTLLNDFLTTNSLKDRDRYTCSKFSLPSATIAISLTAEDVDRECAAKIEREKMAEDALKFLKYQCVYEPDRFSFLGIGRYIRDEFSGEEEDNFDLGTRVIWHPAIDSKLQLSAEYLRRFGGEQDDRFVGGVRYKINNTYELFSSVGKAFDDGFDGNNFITIFGIDIGLGKSTLPAPLPESAN